MFFRNTLYNKSLGKSILRGDEVMKLCVDLVANFCEWL